MSAVWDEAQRADEAEAERDEAVELLKRWQYNDTTAPGPVDDTADFLGRVYDRQAAQLNREQKP